MKLSLRITLFTILLGLLGATVAGLWVSYSRNARFAANDLSTQILDQTSCRIDRQINHLLLTARQLNDLNLRLLRTGQFHETDFEPLARYWVEVMQVHPRLTRLSIGLEAEGETLSVRRQRNGQLVIGELRRNPRTGARELRDYRPVDYPVRPFFTGRHKDADDPRTLPWYRVARAAKRPAWPETYALLGVRGQPGVPGITCATPWYRDKSLVGVLEASFDLEALCRFLRSLHVGDHGFAFVAEYRADGSRRVIAHPDPKLLLRPGGPAQPSELVPPDELADPTIPAFLAQVPASYFPSSETEHMIPVRFTVGAVPYLGGYRCLAGDKTPDWLIAVVLPEADVFGAVHAHNRVTVFIGVCVLAGAILISLYVSAQVSRPLEQLARETTAVGQLQVEAHSVAHSVVLEVDRLAVATEEMKTSLRSFQKYVPAELVRALLASGQEARLGGERRTVTTLFCDIVQFTAIAEQLTPEQVVEQLGEHLGAWSALILAAGGTVDKYIGDAVMAFWGAPAVSPRHALDACVAALRGRRRQDELVLRWKAAGRPLFRTRLGLNTGEVVVGNIGCEARLNYTVIGDAVNLASRLEGLNKLYGTDILISERTYHEAGPEVVARPVDWVLVKGRTEAVLVYELLGVKDDVAPTTEFLAAIHAQALARYRQQDWAGAVELFERVLCLRPADGPAREMIARCLGYRAAPPGEAWDGVHRVACK